MKRVIRITAILAAAVLLFSGTAAAEITEEEIIGEVELEDDSPLLGLAEDIVFHSANENSPVKCNHPLCFWNMKMGWMDEVEIWEVLTQPVTVLEGNQRKQHKVRVRPEEQATMNGAFDRAAECAMTWVREGINAAMNTGNRK